MNNNIIVTNVVSDKNKSNSENSKNNKDGMDKREMNIRLSNKMNGNSANLDVMGMIGFIINKKRLISLYRKNNRILKYEMCVVGETVLKDLYSLIKYRIKQRASPNDIWSEGRGKGGMYFNKYRDSNGKIVFCLDLSELQAFQSISEKNTDDIGCFFFGGGDEIIMKYCVGGHQVYGDSLSDIELEKLHKDFGVIKEKNKEKERNTLINTTMEQY